MCTSIYVTPSILIIQRVLWSYLFSHKNNFPTGNKKILNTLKLSIPFSYRDIYICIYIYMYVYPYHFAL